MSWGGGEFRNYRTDKGSARKTAGRLNLDIPTWGPPYFGVSPPNCLIFSLIGAPFPTTNWRRRGISKLPNRQWGDAARYGAPRNAIFRYAALGAAIFWRISPESYNIPFAQHTVPNYRRGKAGGFRNYQTDNGAAWDTTERYVPNARLGKAGVANPPNGPRGGAEHNGAAQTSVR